MKIVVTGGLGYIGSCLAKQLISKGHDVLIVDASAKEHKGERPPCPIVYGDITDRESLHGIQAKGYDVVLHLAAQSSGPRSFSIPETDFKINILGTLNVIDWCRANAIPRLLFASSFVVYGDQPGKEILKEDDPCIPKSIYALSKFTCEQLLRIYATPHGLQWNVLRMFNVYGVGQDLSRTDQGMVSIFLGLVRKGDHVQVNGSLDRFRDLVYIDDIVQGWERCLNDPSHPNEIYNLGSGVKTTISTLLDTIIEASQKTGRVWVEEVGTTPGDMKGCCADLTKIKSHFNYAPQFDLKKGVHQMVEWANTLP